MRVKFLSLVTMGFILASCGGDCPEQAGVVFTPEGQFNAPGSLADFRATGDRVHFDFDKSHIVDTDVVTRMSAWLKQYNKVVELVGHCDERGTLAYNDLLGQRRANELRKALASSGCGHLITGTYSAGKRYPIVAGNDESAYAQNRVAIAVLKDSGCSAGAPAAAATPAAAPTAEASADMSPSVASDSSLGVPEM